jgi:rhodanese-related sulfurtransferase
MKRALNLVREAEKNIVTLSLDEAQEAMNDENTVIVDVRDVRELWREGKIPGAFHSPRGMNEFWIDPESPYHKPIYASGKRFVLYCGAAWRSALEAKMFKEMGIENVAHIAGYREAFSRLDGDSVANLWHSPSGITHSNRDGDAADVTWWNDNAPMRDNMRKLCDIYRDNDYSHANFRIETFYSLGAHHAFADLHWDLIRRGGESLQSFRTGYNLVRTGEGIRVLMVTQYQEDISTMKQDSKDVRNAAQ